MSCVIVSVCSALLVAMNHITRCDIYIYMYNIHIFYTHHTHTHIHTHNPPSASACTCARARVSAVCVYHTCVRRTCVRRVSPRARTRACEAYVYRTVCVLLGVRMLCARYVTRFYVLARTRHGNRARRGAMDSKRNGAVLLVRAPLASITCRTAPLCRYFFHLFLFHSFSLPFFFFFRLIGLRAFA